MVRQLQTTRISTGGFCPTVSVPGTGGGPNTGAAVGSNSGTFSLGSNSYSNYFEVDPMPSELSRNRRELEEEDVEEEVAFHAMQEHLDIYGMEDGAKEDAPPHVLDVVVLTA
ncbi:hypothetical protein D1007_32687 [Hordeum vulgare]|nr:hypothetical protein D1007_32687 [Hordeum vulgare]